MPYVMLEQKGAAAIRMRDRALYMVASNEDSIVRAGVGDMVSAAPRGVALSNVSCRGSVKRLDARWARVI